MSWKKHREAFRGTEPNETHFILGIDLGEESSVIAYYDTNRRTPEIIDVSGGYGKPSVPTAMQYIPETKEWIYGEYAVLNADGGETFRGLLEKVNRGEYIDAGGKPVSAVNVLGMYIKELIANCKNINPKAEIAGIVLSVPSYLSEEAKASLALSVKAAGYDEALIGLFTDRECIFNHYYQKKPVEKERVLLFDFAGREFRGGIYEITPGVENKVNIVSISSLFDRELGTMCINDSVNALFTRYYNEQEGTRLTSAVKEQLKAFAHQHKDLLFVKNDISAKPKDVKLYFNFAYPPFQKTVTSGDIEAFIAPFRERMLDFFQNVFKRTLMPESMASKSDIDTVICTGGGFEMLWAKQLVSQYFDESGVVFYKSPKGAVAEGACLIAAGQLNVDRHLSITMSDFHKLKADVGIIAAYGKNEKFIAMAETNSFWWQPRERSAFILRAEAETAEETNEDARRVIVVKRGRNGHIEPLGQLVLEGLPDRPEGVTKIGIEFSFPTYDKLVVEVTDLGFGEMFPATDYCRKFEFAYG